MHRGHFKQLPATPPLHDSLPPPGDDMPLLPHVMLMKCQVFLASLHTGVMVIGLQRTCSRIHQTWPPANLPGPQDLAKNDSMVVSLRQLLVGVAFPSLPDILYTAHVKSHNHTPSTHTWSQPRHTAAWSLKEWWLVAWAHLPAAQVKHCQEYLHLLNVVLNTARVECVTAVSYMSYHMYLYMHAHAHVRTYKHTSC